VEHLVFSLGDLGLFLRKKSISGFAAPGNSFAAFQRSSRAGGWSPLRRSIDRNWVMLASFCDLSEAEMGLSGSGLGQFWSFLCLLATG
jgi:hypothetical protein